MTSVITPTQRPRLKLLVPDSGRTWLVMYDKITQIPPAELQLGDVLIAKHPTEPGTMAMQVTRPHKNAWQIDELELSTT